MINGQGQGARDKGPRETGQLGERGQGKRGQEREARGRGPGEGTVQGIGVKGAGGF